MSPVQNVWRQLVQRRLWPVAIVLVAALAAVPVLLAKDPEPVPAPPAPAADSTDGELASQPIVSLASADPTAKRRKVLGTPKNPFRVDPPKVPNQADEGSSGESTPTGGQPVEQTGGSGGGDSAPPSSDAPAAPTTPATPTEPAPAPKKYAPQELTVRFGGGEQGGERMSVKVGEPLPSTETPVLIYTKLLKDGKTAEFLVAEGVTAVGDGECKPSPEVCETIRLKVGETEFLDVVDETGGAGGQYQLDLLKIHRPGGHSTPSRTMSVRAKSGARRSELRAVAGRVSAFLP